MGLLVSPVLAATIHVSTFGAFPDDGLDDTEAINNAVNSAVPGDVIVFAAGTYDLIDPLDANRFIQVNATQDLTIRGATSGGAPATRLLRHVAVENMASPPRAIYAVDGDNLTIENLIVDNTPHLGTSGTITAVDPQGKYVEAQIFSGLPMVAGTACYAANVWDPVTGDLKHVRSLTETVSPANWTIKDAGNRIMRLYKSDGLSFINDVAVGELMSWHYGWNGRSQLEFARLDGLTFRNISIPNAINMGILIGSTKDITLTDIVMRSEGNQLPVGPRDGIHISRSTGDIVCERLDITGVRLDGIVVRTPYAEITSITSATQFRIATELFTHGQPIPAGSGLSFISPTGNLFNRVVSTATYVSQSGGKSYYDIVTVTNLPSFVTAGTPLKVAAIGPSSVRIADSSFSNIGGSSMILFADNTTVDNVDNYNIMYPAIHAGSNSTAGVCGSNLTIKNSAFDTCGWVTKGGRGSMISLANNHATYTEARLKNVTIQDNVFINQFFDPNFAAIQVANTDGITIVRNLWENVWRGLEIEMPSVTEDSVIDNVVINDNDDNTNTYLEVSGSFASSGLTGYNGSGTRFASGSGAKAEWVFVCPKTDTYRVYVYKVQHSTSDTNAKISVHHAGGTAVSYLNYATGSSGWVDLGAYSFSGQGTYKLINERANGYLRADAVRFIQE